MIEFNEACDSFPLYSFHVEFGLSRVALSLARSLSSLWMSARRLELTCCIVVSSRTLKSTCLSPLRILELRNQVEVFRAGSKSLLGLTQTKFYSKVQLGRGKWKSQVSEEIGKKL